MMYVCKTCDFLFWRTQIQTECPFCQGKQIHEITAQEGQRMLEMQRDRQEAGRTREGNQM